MLENPFANCALKIFVSVIDRVGPNDPT